MKSISRLLLALGLTAAAATQCLAQQTTYSMRMTMRNGSVMVIPVDSIGAIDFPAAQPSPLEALTGAWQLIASTNGVPGPDGIYRATTDTIRFTATLGQDASLGTCLYCHADSLYTRSEQVYPADWCMAVETDETNGSVRLGWVLSDQQPASPKEFTEERSKYLEEGLYYWGVGADRTDTGHRYIYLLSVNIDKQQLEGMTLWSEWTAEGSRSFAFPQNQQVYGVVALDIPYDSEGESSVGYFEIWASPRMKKQ